MAEKPTSRSGPTEMHNAERFVATESCCANDGLAHRIDSHAWQLGQSITSAGSLQTDYEHQSRCEAKKPPWRQSHASAGARRRSTK